MCESFQIVLAIPRCGAGSDSVSLRHTSFPSTITYYLIFTTNFGIPCVLSAVNVEMFIVYRLILTSEPRRTMWNGSNRRGGAHAPSSHTTVRTVPYVTAFDQTLDQLCRFGVRHFRSRHRALHPCVCRWDSVPILRACWSRPRIRETAPCLCSLVLVKVRLTCRSSGFGPSGAVVHPTMAARTMFAKLTPDHPFLRLSTAIAILADGQISPGKYWTLKIFAFSSSPPASCGFCTSSQRFAIVSSAHWASFRFEVTLDNLGVRLLVPLTSPRRDLAT